MPTIPQLNAVTTLNNGDQIVVYSQNDGDARKITLYNLLAWIADSFTTGDDKITQYSAPSSSGFTVNITDSSQSVWLVLTPTGSMAAGTIKMPTSTNCADRQEVLINCTQAITSLTINGNGATVTGAPTSFSANGYARFRYEAVSQTWYRIG